MLEYLELRAPEPSYTAYSEAVTALECAKLELYRRCVAQHEDKAAERNGDVYPAKFLGETP